MAWLFRDPITLSDGVTVHPTRYDTEDKSASGYANVGMRHSSRTFIPWVSRQQARQVDPRLDDAQPDNASFHLGVFKDPRVAAWVANNFLQNPPDSDFIDNYLNTHVQAFGNEGLASMYNINNIDFPEDVFNLPITAGTEEMFMQARAEADEKANAAAEKAAEKAGFRNAEEMKQALEKGIKTGEEWQRYLKNEKAHVQRIKDQDGELKFSELLKNPEFKKAWDATGEEKNDARDWVIQKVQQGSSDDEILQGLRNYLSESVLCRILQSCGLLNEYRSVQARAQKLATKNVRSGVSGMGLDEPTVPGASSGKDIDKNDEFWQWKALLGNDNYVPYYLGPKPMQVGYNPKERNTYIFPNNTGRTMGKRGAQEINDILVAAGMMPKKDFKIDQPNEYIVIYNKQPIDLVQNKIIRK